MTKVLSVILVLILMFGCQSEKYDILIKNGNVIDGSGSPKFSADVAIRNGKIVLIAEEIFGDASEIIQAKGLVVSPGFVDMLSWACGPILYDGQAPSVVRQGITTAIFGEGWSMGPVNENVIKEMSGWWKEYNIQYNWKTLADYLRYVEKKGTSINVASFVGATTVRMHAIGFEDRKAKPQELEKMKDLVRLEMEAGALGVASSLVYTPAFYADTDELIELSKVAAEYGGIYASHIRGEGSDLIPALQEFLTICEQADISGEVYHFKAAGKENWDKLDEAIKLIEQARERGLSITADIYPYTAGATGLDAMIPPWAKEGGNDALVERLKNPAVRKKIKEEIESSFSGWENFYWMAGSGKNILVSYMSEKNKNLQGKTIAEIARLRNKDEIDVLFDLLVEENGGGGGIYFLMSEENVMKKMLLPWVSFCTDEDAYRPAGLMGKRHPHPRAYGAFPRILGKYVREGQMLTLEEAIRKMTSLPAQKLGLDKRGLIKKDMIADIVIFNPETIIDKATYKKPHQFSEGVSWVIVNGQIVVKDGRHTGAKPGKAIFKKKAKNKKKYPSLVFK